MRSVLARFALYCASEFHQISYHYRVSNFLFIKKFANVQENFQLSQIKFNELQKIVLLSLSFNTVCIQAKF